MIEKLSRRQQIQAMLAIQKRQQQLVHQKCSQENQIKTASNLCNLVI
jgi:hypothetical protein